MGAIKIILRARSRSKQDSVQQSLRELLALLGYADPVPNMGIRVLSIDGGGIRGLLVLEMLKKLEEITGKRINEMFDIICGVSTGAILAFSIGKQFIVDIFFSLYLKFSEENFFWGFKYT